MLSSELNQSRLVTVFGGSGFVGRYAVRALAKGGWRVRVACRRPDLAVHLQPLGKVGQIQAVQANLRHPPSVMSAVRGANSVVNLAGILMPKGRQNFDAVHAFGARTVAKAATIAGVEHLIQMSALGAGIESNSSYSRSKALGESLVLESFPSAKILRPSVIFGPEDRFFNRFAAIARISPVLPLFGGGETRFQPVYVGDVATAIADLAAGRSIEGNVLELGGPEIRSFEALLRYVVAITGRKRLFLPVPWPVANVQAFGLELANTLSLGLWPDWLTVTRDQVKLLQTDNIVSASASTEGRTLQGLGINPVALDTIVPNYLYRFRKAGQFTAKSSA